MIRAFRELGHEVQECAPDIYRKDTGEGGSAGWVGKLKAILPGHAYEVAELAYSVIAYRRLSKAIRRFHPDLIYERHALFNLAGIAASRRYSVPLFLEVNAPYATARRASGLRLRSLAAHLETLVWRSATRVLPVTEVLAAIIEAGGVPRARILVVPNAVNPEDYRDLPTVQEAKARLGLQDRIVIGFTGFVCEWDRLDRVLSWMARRQDRDRLHLLVVGDGPVRAQLEACARQLGISDRLTFTGVVARRQVPALAMAFDIALQTALVPYASPLCLFEYLALGKAIVAPDQPNHHEVLKPDVDAILYPPHDSDGLERRLEALVVEPELRQKLGSAAAAAIGERRLTWRHNASLVLTHALGLSDQLNLRGSANATAPEPTNEHVAPYSPPAAYKQRGRAEKSHEP